jgi:hypothetical protein
MCLGRKLFFGLHYFRPNRQLRLKEKH